MKKNILNGMYDGGNMMVFATEDNMENNMCCPCVDGVSENDEKKYDYLLPIKLRRILMYINNESDKYEYEGSPMFDELPDRNFIDMMVKKILAEYIMNEKDNDNFVDNNVELLIYALLLGVIVYRKNRHESITNGLR